MKISSIAAKNMLDASLEYAQNEKTKDGKIILSKIVLIFGSILTLVCLIPIIILALKGSVFPEIIFLGFFCLQGKSKFEILKEMGYDPEVLGLSRVEGITYHIRKEAEEPEGFHEGRRTRAPYSLSTDSFAELQQAQALRHLQAEVLYLRQEIEFIKKIMQTENLKGRRK